MSALRPFLCRLVLLLPCFGAQADVIAYQGRLTMDGKGVSGAAQFRFSLIGADNLPAWESGDVDVMLRDGKYSVRLGDAESGMPAIPREISSRALRLRISSRVGKSGWQQFPEEVSLSSAPRIAPPTLTEQQALALISELNDLREKVRRAEDAKKETLPTIVSIPVGGLPAYGKPEAPLVLVEFIDFQSGACRLYHQQALPELLEEYVNAGKLAIVTRFMPEGPMAEPLARACIAAGQQGRYVEFRNHLFASAELDAGTVLKCAESAGLDMARFHTALADKETAAAVQVDFSATATSSIRQAPSFVLGRRDGEMIVGTLLNGLPASDRWEKEIQNLLARQK